MLKMLIYFLLILIIGLMCQSKPKLVCYWEHNSGDVSVIDIKTCTHVHYSFMVLDPNSLLMTFENNNGEADLQKLLSLKSLNPKLRIIVALGGWTDSAGDKYGRLITSPESRTKFIKNTLKFINKYNLDGLDFDYEFPACPQTQCDPNKAAEKNGFANILRETKRAFRQNSRNLSLSVAVNVGDWILDQAYDLKVIARTCNYIVMMTYDNAGGWLKMTGHHSGFQWSKQRMQVWADKGIPKRKLLMGVPFYAITVQLANSAEHGLGAPIIGGHSHMTYSEVCSAVKSDNLRKERSKEGPIAYMGNKWLSYDDPKSIAMKSRWVANNGFGGILVWQVAQDDVNGQCCQTAKPLMKAIAFGLFKRGQPPKTYDCE